MKRLYIRVRHGYYNGEFTLQELSDEDVFEVWKEVTREFRERQLKLGKAHPLEDHLKEIKIDPA